MDREKKQLKRSANKVKPLHVSDFIALGSKSSGRQSDSSEQKKTKSTLISVSTSERKTDVSGPSSSVPVKKAKISSTSNLKRVSSASKKETVKSDEWDTVALEVESTDLVNKVLEAEDCSDDEKVEALLCGAVKKLKSSRSKFDAPLFLSLQYLAKTKPLLFCSELIVEAFCSLLKRDLSINFKAKGNNLVPILASNILMAAYKEESNWPEVFVKAYVEDSLAERVWVDHDYCKGFVDNILTAFKTKSIPKNLMIPDRLFKPEACPSPPNIGTDDDESCSSVNIEIQENLDSVAVFPRYMHSEESLTQYVLDVIREQMTRRQPTEVSRNTLRFLVSTCGISEVRLTVSQKLEMWLQNPKLTKPAQELLLAVCLNCNQHNQHDVEVISQLIKIRIKAKPIINHYLLCMKELICQHPDNLNTLLKHAIYNELSTSRNPNNMQLLSIIFQHSPDKAAKVLADVFLDLLCNRDDYLRALRGLLREIVRTVRHDLNFSVFCSALLQEKKEATFLELEMPLKERVFLSITDLIVLAIFLGVSPAVKEQFSTCSRGEKRDLTQLRNYQLQVSNIQRDSVYWLYSTVPKLFKPGRNEFIHSIHKLLFMEQIEHYYNKDNWPTESERMLLLRLASEVPLLEDTLTRVLIIGLSREHPLTAPDALELADQLIKRAAMTYCDDFPVLEFENTELCDLIFNLCAYHHPENITLPQGYHPPNLAISELYWKAWTMLLIIICHNPSTFGDMAWKTYPMLRNLMEMCITNQFIFPPPTLALGEKAEEIKNRELQMSQMEKDQILLFETHLAAASTKVTITESNSLLLSKLISMDPHGPARKPPAVVLEQLKAMNSKLKLGDLLCHSRNPDFLLDVIQRQGTTQSMSWLSELVESSASSFNMLPVQCLCEFLISDAGSVNDSSDDGDRSCVKKKKKQEQLLFHLQKLLHEPDSEPHDTIEVISYFMKRLSSQQTSARTLALKGLDMLLYQPNKSPISDDEDLLRKNEIHEYNWLSKSIPSLPHFDVIRSQISLFLRQACQIENDPLTIASYVTFLAVHTPDHNLQEFADLALDMAQMIVERPTIVNTILPLEGNCNGHGSDFLSSVSEIFFKYLSAAKIPSKEVYSWSESQDQILIQWASGESATMHILVVHAMIIVLTYGPPVCGRRSYFDALLEIWFPTDGEQPKAFLVDTSEEALLLPDWLKLRMIRSSVGVLVDAALKDLDPSQLVLFIQSFGIPVSSMSKLLRTLDLAVEFDSFSVEQAVLDKSYMSQLVEVQHRRGASGGVKFAKLLLDADSTEMNTDCDTVLNQTPVIQRAPPKLPTAIGIESVSISLVKLLGLNPALGVLSAKQEQDLFKGLQKALSKDILDKSCDNGAVSVFILTCEQILRSDSKMAFLQALHKKSYYSSVLFRLATASQAKADVNKSQLAQKLKWICQQIIYFVSATNSSLLTVASQYYNKHKPPETKKPVPWKLFIQQYADNLDIQNIMNVVQLAETKDSLRLEEVMQYLVKNAISNGDTKPLMNAMTNITLKRLTDNASQSIQTFKRSKFCFFVDWLECLEPKIMSSFPQSQCHLLFSLIGTPHESITVPFRPYLLALLIHQSSWEILHYYIQTILNPDAVEIKFDPTSVLDFLHACIYIPKIWQGRYKKKNKRGNEEDILALSDFQIKSVINYILEEALMKCPKESSASIAKGISIIEWRMKLLLKCLALRRSLINSSVQHLLQIIKEDGIKSKLGSELLLQTYHQIPAVLTLISDCLSFLSEGSNAAKTSHCNLDVISHTLLISLARTDSSKHCISKMARIEFICKKMASSHPVLLLRQLPMMTALLRGRVHLEYPLFRQQNHVTLFGCFLSILELLPPFLFKSEYCSDLHNILSLYMDVFQTYGTPKEILQLLNRFFSFLLQYLAAKPAYARQFIQQYIDTLQDLASQHQDLASLRSILTGSCMHYWAAPGTASGSEEKMEASIHDVIAGLQFQSNVSQTHLSTIITRLTQGSSEDISVALQELESISYKKPAVLEHVVDNLKSLMHDTNVQFRMSAFNLVMRYVKNNPNRGLTFISSYLQCLESERVDIVLTALEHLPEFVVLVQEYATVLLQKTFSVGIMKNINTAPQIRGTIAYLVAQSGC
ncbi:integrator complex subunit 1-like [Stegodyphus dumicola]|uniref:integrator complex subunit 1-like n=1 Tax=Stegodyphus dumicola TaxID=202533 RepID=UPI0015AC4B39|nr:integrator complex subunit 1-like [Stegodyphus dumicola]XP_035215177.1 integrator complex subunit 1-like [Stegodyphus dumicola]